HNRDAHSPDVALACAPVDPCCDGVVDKASVDIGLSSEKFLPPAEGAALNELSRIDEAFLDFHLLRRGLRIRHQQESPETPLSIPGPTGLRWLPNRRPS